MHIGGDKLFVDYAGQTAPVKFFVDARPEPVCPTPRHTLKE